jgi:opacity protein-like surface antigen
MKRVSFLCLILFLLLSSINSLLYSQDIVSEKKHRAYINVGGGYATTGSIFSSTFAYQSYDFLYMLQYRHVDEEEGTVNFPALASAEYGASAGWVFRIEDDFIVVSAGLSFNDGNERGKFLYRKEPDGWNILGTHVDVYEDVYYRTIGVPVSIHVTKMILPFIGIGLELGANFNTHESYYSVSTVLHVGHSW